jgi:hypothetical protein
MAFDLGGLFGGSLSGAAAGSAFGPIGTIGGAILGGVGGGLTGGGPAEYQFSPLQKELMGYGYDQVKASPERKKAIREQFKSLRQGGNRGAAEAFLESYRDRFSNPEFIEKRLAKSYSKPVDYTGGGFQDIAQSIYGQQGVGYSSDGFTSFANRAKSLGIRSPQAFGDMLKQDLIASGKVMTPQQEMLANVFGTPERDLTGRLTGRYGSSRQPVKMPDIPAAVTYQYGA